MKRIRPIEAALLLLLGGAAPCLAQTREPGVRDAARMFSPDAVAKADARLRDLARDGGWQVFVETIEALENQTIEDRARADARGLNVHGLIVVISKRDHKLDFQPSRSAEKVFTKEKLARLVKRMSADFGDKKFDQGLLDTVAAIENDARVVGVRDTAKMFSPDAIRKANAALAAIRQQNQWQVIIETVESLDGQTAAERAAANGEAMNVRGLSIVIAKKEHKLDVVASKSARPMFTREKTAAIARAIEGDFHAKQFDKGLLDAVAAIEADACGEPLVAAAPPAPTKLGVPLKAEKAAPPLPAVPGAEPARTPNVLPMVLIGVVGILALLWMISLARRRASVPPPQQGWPQPQPRQPEPGTIPPPRPAQTGYGPPPAGYGPGYGPGPGYPPPPPQHGGGLGSFAAGALGGLGGAIAGNILYDQFGRPHHPDGVGTPPDHTAAGVFPPAHPNTTVEPPRETFDPNAGASGDWSGDDRQSAPPPDAWEGAEGASGDWGTGAPDQDTGTTGDWGGNEPAADDAGATGDWGGDSGSADADADAGGDWGGGASDQDAGGSW